jgi:RHS repeat-associated protein
MRIAVRWLVLCLLCCMGLGCWSAGAAQAAAGAIGFGTSSLAGGVVVPGMQLLDEGEQVLDAEEARRSSPAVVAEREASRTQFERLDAEQARREAAVAFPGTIDEPAGGPPYLPPGQKILGYPRDDAAQVELGEGKHAVIESSAAMAVETSRGRREPLDLSLTHAGSGFEPTTALVGVTIPKRLSRGVALPKLGVSLTPVNAQGVPLGGAEGVVEGASVVYANTQPDSDTVVKPTSTGFEADVLLRSVDSPERLYFRVGLPAGATLVESDRGSHSVRVVKDGAVIAAIRPPHASDAAGTSVPVAMRVTGSMLVLTVDMKSGHYQYPAEVDPEVYDYAAPTSEEGFEPPTNFHFIHEGSQFTAGEAGEGTGWRWTEHIGSGHKTKEWGALAYTTQGDSYITRVTFYGSWYEKGDHIENVMEIVNPKGEAESKWVLPEESGPEDGWGVTAPETKEGHRSSAPNSSAEYLTESNGEGGAGETILNSGNVEIGQETYPFVSFNTASPTVDGQPNVMYGTANWLGPKSGAAEFTAEDSGIGIETWTTQYNGGSGYHGLAQKNLIKAGLCAGIQCPEKVKEYITYSSALPNGEPTLGINAGNGIGTAGEHESEGDRRLKVKVDGTPPTGITISGLGSGNEIGEGEYDLKAEATGSLAGVKTMALSVDGREVGKANGSCTGSGCIAKAEWQISGGEFGAGENKLKVTATDSADNEGTDELTLKVHHATPIALDPGSVDPQSGELTLSANDVTEAAPGANLEVIRDYRSRHLTAGAEGPLGPQWSLSAGGQESITKLPNGNATLTMAAGGQTTFTGSGGGKFASPTGDSNLALTEVKNEKGELTEYVLKETTNGAITRFTSTEGPTASQWRPTKQEGPLTSETSQSVRYAYQTVEGVTEPKYAVAPEPAGVEGCLTRLEKKEELVKGCRALTFEYAHETTAKGEKPSEWKAYKGRLKEVLYTDYNPATEKATPLPVAEYAYDAKGRLRAEWNPQISPALTTSYGYDAEGHVTAVDPAGQQPWLLHYGSIPADASTGRLLSVTRPAAATPVELKAEDEAAPPAYSNGITLSSTKPAVGTKISVSSEGTWTNSPIVYSYDWEDCNSSGGECKPIAGAVNQSYYPAKSDEGHTLVAQVNAVNADGTAVAASAATSVVATGTPTSPAPEPPAAGTSAVWTVEYQVPLSGAPELPTMTKGEEERWGQTDDPVEASAIFPPDSPEGWPAKAYARATVEYLDNYGRTVNGASPTGGVSTTEYNTDNDVIRTLTPDNRAKALKESCEKEKCKSAEVAKALSTESTYEEKGSEPGSELLSTLGPEHTVELTSGSEVEAREHTVYSYDEGAPETGGPYDLVTKTTQGAVVAGTEEPASVRTTKTAYSGAGSQELLGWKLRKPISVTTDPNGLDLVHTTEYEPSTGDVSETKLPAASGKDVAVPPAYSLQFGAKGGGSGEFKAPEGDALDSSGDVWVADRTNHRLEKFSATGAFIDASGFGVSNGKEEYEVCTSGCEAGLAGTGNGQFWSPEDIAIDGGDIYVTDATNNRVQEFNEKNEIVGTFGENGTSGGDFKEPAGITSDSSGDIWVVDHKNERVERFTAAGKFIEAVGFGVTNGKEEFQICTSSCQAGRLGSGKGQFDKPEGIAFDGGDLYIADLGSDRVVEINEKGEYASEFGSAGAGSGQFEEPVGIAAASTGGDVYVVDSGNNRVEKFSTTGTYVAQFGFKGTGNGQLNAPQGIAVNTAGGIYVVDSTNARIEKWVPTITGNEGAHDTKTTYYTTGVNKEYETCGKHPEWAGLVCETRPVAQPENVLPELPVTTVTAYNKWDEPETTVEDIGSSTRTNTERYDAGGRLKTESTTSTEGTALPTVTDEYSSETGALVKQCRNEGKPCTEGKPKTITSVFNTLGQLTSYTDASEITATYEYDVDGRAHKTNDGKGTQTYTYNTTTGLLSELADSAHEGMKFTATYDIEGNLLSESYPNGMTAYYTYNPNSTATGLEYKKLTDCTEEKEKCKWFTDTIVPSIHGQWLSQTSTLSKQAYTYDAAGRLAQVQNTPAGKDCTTRVYAYDEDANRTSLTTRESSTEKCATEGGTIESYTYDTADRLTDPGIAYNTFGDITTVPASDAAGKSSAENLTSTYYVDNQLDTQTQNEQTIGYNLDPAGRTIETVETGKKVADIVSNYAGPSSEPSWTVNTSGETSRNIHGINGQLAAIQNNSEAPVLELANLHGDIIGTASYSETATELASKADTSEFGVPTLSLPPKHSWLGAFELSTEELPSGAIDMGARSYVPEIGRFLQPDPISGGSANAYTYSFGDPVNTFDLTGEFVEGAYLYGANDAENARSIEREAAREAAAKAAAEAAAKAAAEAAARAAGPQAAEGEQGPLGGYTGWACEYAAETGQEDPECDGGGGGRGGDMQFITYPDDHSPNIQSTCNRTGQDCPGKRGGGHGGGGNAGDTCRTVAGATGPLAVMTGPGGIILWVIGFGTCELN